MSIFDPTDKTTAQIRFETIKERSGKLHQGEKNRCLAAFNDLWGSKETPISAEEAQAILDLFGNDAIQLFLIHKAWQDFIKAVDPSYEYLVPPYEMVYNEDGTVTVGAAIE